MRLLYLHYGPQSGVTASITAALAARGHEVLLANPADGFLWSLAPGSRIPNPRPAAVLAFGAALARHGRAWKALWLHTPYAFDRLSRRAADAVHRARPHAVLQAGALFGPGPFPEAPYHLYLDHTRAIALRYAPAPGLPPTLAPDAALAARERAVYRGAAGIFTMSEFVKGSLVADYGVDAARVHVVGAGPNVGPSDAPGAPAGAPAPGASAGPGRTLLFVGRAFAPKGGPVLLEAFRRLREARPDLADLRLEIVARTAPGPLPPGAVFHGLLDPPALARRFAAASAFALPTLREAFGLVLLEAMAFGLPVVASRIEAIPEIVSHGETGLLVPPGDAAALSRALADVLSDPVRSRLLGAAGRARLEARYGWDRAATAMLEVLRTARRPRGGAVRAG